MISKLHADRSGNVAVVFALSLLPVMGLLGAAVDYSMLNDQRSKMQSALDAAVLAGALESGDGAKVSRASSNFTANYNPKWAAASTSFTVAGKQLDGTATATIPMQFLSVVGITKVPVTVRSSALASGSSTKVCILVVASPDAQTLLVNSGASVSGLNCEIHVDSTAGAAGMINAGTSLKVAKVCIKGSATQNGGPYPVVSTNCAAISNPYVGALPSVSAGGCTYNNQTYNPGTVTLSPGTYCGWTNFNGSGTLKLNPGLYVVKNGGMIFNSGWTVSGTGVTFYLADQNATLTFNGNVTTNLTAPTSGSYANILMFEPDGLPRSNLPINGTSGSHLTGMMYLPSRDVTINSVSNVSADGVAMVFATLILNATNWSIEPGPLAPDGSSGTTSVRLTK